MVACVITSSVLQVDNQQTVLIYAAQKNALL